MADERDQVTRRRGAPARFPPGGAWPGVMRADMAAAFFDLDDTAALTRAVERGEAPRPTDARSRGGRREPLWSTEACRNFVMRRHLVDSRTDAEDLVDML